MPTKGWVTTGMSQSENATVLVVDDDESLNDLYVERLEHRYTVRSAYNGEDALARLDEDVDVVLLDRRMPDLTGGEVLEHIRERGYECRVAMLTGVEPDVDIIEMACDDYITKPVDAGELRDLVASLLVRERPRDPGEEPLSLAAKKAALEANRDPSEFESAAEYRALLDRLDEARAEVREHLEALERGESTVDYVEVIDFEADSGNDSEAGSETGLDSGS